MARVRENILKAGIVGRLVANDFSGALVSAIVLEEDANGSPSTRSPWRASSRRKSRKGIEGSGIAVHARGGGVGDAAMDAGASTELSMST